MKRARRGSRLGWKTWLLIIAVVLAVGALSPKKAAEQPQTTRLAAVTTPAPTSKPTPRPSPSPTPQPTETPEPTPIVMTYVLNTNSKKFHCPGCASVGDMLPKNRQDYEGTREEVLAMGYKPCGRCKP